MPDISDTDLRARLEGRRDQIMAAIKHVHKATCPEPARTHQQTCIACPRPLGVYDALAVLDANPRDAKGARRALHDAVCASGCGPDSDHADRTQSKRAAALRRFHRGETTHADR